LIDMPTDKEPKGLAAVIHAILSFIPEDLKDMVGTFAGFVLAFAVPVAIVLAVMLLYYAMQNSKYSTTPCWQIQAVDQRLFKLNTCTGELVEVKDVPTASQETSTKKKKK
jgi:hypothetical protein